MLKHDWKGGGGPVRYPYKTERACGRCRLVKVTRHEPQVFPWVEWWKDGERLEAAPPCEDANADDQRQGQGDGREI